jgi:putative ABC transport system permease protein
LAAIINQHFGAGLFEYRLDFTLCIVPLLVMALVAILSGVAAGTIPALGSMAITPADAVKRKYTLARSSSRGWLTVVQFAATIALIAMSALTVKQVRFMKNRPLGFDKENRMVIIPTNDLVENLEAFELALQKSPLIETTALSNGVPGVPSNMEGFRFNDETYQTWLWNVDDKYVKMMNFELTEGRHFLPDSEAEQNSIIINETARRQFGLELGSHIMRGDAEGKPVYFQVVGVIKDFNFASLRESVEPFMFRYMPDTFYGFVNVKLATNDVRSTVDFITQEYNRLSPNEPIRYYFLDERLNLLYDKEDRVIGMIAMFSLLSLVVSVLGVLGLSIFTSQYRIREIGIRKVNGASIPEIVQMLNRNVVVWLGIAFVIATPIAYFAMSRWLENFAYKTALSWWIFAIAGLAALVVALLTVSWQSLRAASRNPVEALKYE